MFMECPVSGGGAKTDEMIMKQALLAPIWMKIGVPYIVFREESDGDIPGASVLTKMAKN